MRDKSVAADSKGPPPSVGRAPGAPPPSRIQSRIFVTSLLAGPSISGIDSNGIQESGGVGPGPVMGINNLNLPTLRPTGGEGAFDVHGSPGHLAIVGGP